MMDNVAFHRSVALYALLAKHKIEVLYTPVYSPMLNPIEFANEYLKRKLREELRLQRYR